eukprot:TRINITY_DN4981_c0_g1_i1.p2 TRINITY_DN4981_c0_g1~~TRINITY_DN4981_c0_g1_i1.p2  ORF type:complete len:240 (+),score=130.80 TRINITY_DN4981_c0_g1_i1:46-765(+)
MLAFRVSALRALTKSIFPLAHAVSFRALSTNLVKHNELATNMALLIDEELESFQTSPDTIPQFVKSWNVITEEDYEKGVVMLRWTTDLYSVRVTFELPLDDFTPENDEDLQHESGEEVNDDAVEPEEDEGTEVEKKFNVDIHVERLEKGPGPSVFVAEAAVGKDGNLYLENFRFSETERRLWTSDLSQAFQERTYDWIESMGMNGDMVEYITDYHENFKVSAAQDTLSNLKLFIGAKPL